MMIGLEVAVALRVVAVAMVVEAVAIVVAAVVRTTSSSLVAAIEMEHLDERNCPLFGTTTLSRL